LEWIFGSLFKKDNPNRTAQLGLTTKIACGLCPSIIFYVFFGERHHLLPECRNAKRYAFVTNEAERPGEQALNVCPLLAAEAAMQCLRFIHCTAALWHIGAFPESTGLHTSAGCRIPGSCKTVAVP
jgi:hypothetical protein